ncbi:MAG: hypothetical protein JXB35_17175, partial [Anaerolineae bacterium]|nr:hypothetical protein [Anaerolineae bacterium]
MNENSRKEQLARIRESAKRLGIEINEEEANSWLEAVKTMGQQDQIVVDARTGVFGHGVTMLDFSPTELARFREVGRLVEFYDKPGKVETALALSGSAAQSKIQTYPGDLDFFERVNIKAPTREEACRILGEIMHEKALSTFKGDTYQLIEVKLGSFPADFFRGEKPIPTGSPIGWKPEEVQAGEIRGEDREGKPVIIKWEEAAQDPGWCKLDWVVVDPDRKQLANASNMLDVTWEAPDGSITPLDGYLDSYFQEIYLETESVPIFSKLVKHMSPNALNDYVKALEGQVEKYLQTAPANYGKVAKRMYNIFRLTGRYEEAA